MNADDSNGERFHVGSTIAGRYRVERPIGEGAMGAVALARHVTLDETVAIKFLRPELRRDPVANARLAREAKALARIKSDHVARVLDVGATLSVGPYMVMEYLEGVDLGEVLETEGPLPVPRVVECVLQVCEALTVAHTAGITHRDIKPQNLFLARHGQFETLKILDFGIAENTPAGAGPTADDAAPASSVLPAGAAAGRSVPVYGTPSYMAPERVRNDPDADHRSDIWSVGVVLHELVTGRAVFDADDLTETCARIVSDEPLELEQDDAVLPPSLRAIIARCLERDPARRYQSVEELAAALAPLATMHERFRGRSTGAFSRRLLEEELAQAGGTAAASERRARPIAAPGTWQHAAAGLRAWGARLWESALPRYVGLAAAGVMLAAIAGALIGVRWMSPPPSGVPIRAEPVAAASPAARDSVLESVLPLAAAGTDARAEPVNPAALAPPLAASEPDVGTASAHARSAPSRRAPAGARARSVRHARPSADSAASGDDGARSSDGRSRVRLVEDRFATSPSREHGDAASRLESSSEAREVEDGNSAEAADAAGDELRRDVRAKNKDETAQKEGRQKRARTLPAWLQPFQSKAATPREP